MFEDCGATTSDPEDENCLGQILLCIDLLGGRCLVEHAAMRRTNMTWSAQPLDRLHYEVLSY